MCPALLWTKMQLKESYANLAMEIDITVKLRSNVSA